MNYHLLLITAVDPQIQVCQSTDLPMNSYVNYQVWINR